MARDRIEVDPVFIDQWRGRMPGFPDPTAVDVVDGWPARTPHTKIKLHAPAWRCAPFHLPKRSHHGKDISYTFRAAGVLKHHIRTVAPESGFYFGDDILPERVHGNIGTHFHRCLEPPLIGINRNHHVC